MAQARLADQGGTADPGGYGDVVGDLVLSVQPRGPGNAARLARLVPPLLETAAAIGKAQQGAACCG
jgi:hypothetical protein